jgi:hypothetical protein
VRKNKNEFLKKNKNSFEIIFLSSIMEQEENILQIQLRKKIKNVEMLSIGLIVEFHSE